MLKNRKNQKGILLLEIILALSILSLFLAAVLFLMKRYEDKIRFQSLASQMSQVFEASEEYVKNNYSDVYNQVNSPANFDEISLSELVDNGYLTDGYKLSSLYGKNIKTAVIMRDHDLQLFTLHPYTELLSLRDIVEISSYIKKGYGGVYYTNGSVTSPCVGAACIRGHKGSWFIDSVPATFNTAFAGNLPSDGNEALVLHKKLGYDASPYLNRKKVWNNLAANSMSTDLNLVKRDNSGNEQNVSIIFNAFDDGDSIDNKDLQLLYNPNDPNTGTPTVTLSGDAAPTDPNKLTAILSADGGIGTDLVIKDTTAACSQNGLLAVDESNNFLQCVESNWESLGDRFFVLSNTSNSLASAYLVIRNSVPIIIAANRLIASDTIIGYFE